MGPKSSAVGHAQREAALVAVRRAVDEHVAGERRERRDDRERGAGDRDRRRPAPPSPVMRRPVRDARARSGVAMRRAVRLTVVGSTTATSTPAQVTQASAERGARHRQAVLAERVAERGSEQERQQTPRDAGRPGSSEEGHGTLRFAHARGGWPFSRLTNQGEQWLGSTNGGEGRRPSARGGELHREPAAHRPARGRDLRARAPAAPARRAVAAEPLRAWSG